MLEVEIWMANQCLVFNLSLITGKIWIKFRYHFSLIILVKTLKVQIFGHVENGNTCAWVKGYK